MSVLVFTNSSVDYAAGTETSCMGRISLALVVNNGVKGPRSRMKLVANGRLPEF